MMNLKNILLVTTLTLIFSNSVFSQWTKGKGKGYYKLSAWYLEADQHYTDTGKIDPNATRGVFNVNFYGKHGISDKLDLIAYIPFFSRTYQNDLYSGTTGMLITAGEAVNSVGDIDLGIAYGLIKSSKLALSASLQFGLPTGNSSGGSDGSYQTGDGEFNQLIQVNLGTSFKLLKIPLYAKTYLGFNNKTNDFSDELRTGLETGLNVLNKKIWLIGRLNIVKSLKNGSLSAQTRQGSIFANNVEYTSIGGEIAYNITKKWGISFNYAGAVSGRIIYARPSYSGGVYFTMR